jgi:hypothetical protein
MPLIVADSHDTVHITAEKTVKNGTGDFFRRRNGAVEERDGNIAGHVAHSLFGFGLFV